jgi:hypothetical protein
MIVAFTVVTNDYLVQARTLGNSFLKYNPGYIFVIGLLDETGTGQHNNVSDRFKYIQVSDLEIGYIEEMRERYSNFEFSCALKPFFADHILKELEAEHVIYLDSDIYVFSTFSEIEDLFKPYSIVITPHYLSSSPRNDNNKADLMMLNYGIFNGGFFALSNSPVSANFLDWWKDKLKTECKRDLCNGRFVDQIWLNLCLIYFDNVHILRDPGYNMATWNLCERTVTLVNGAYLVNQKTPLVFFHFSGYSPNQPEKISKNHTDYTFESNPDVIPLFEQYRNELINNGYPAAGKTGQAAGTSGEMPVSLGRKIIRKIKGKLS